MHRLVVPLVTILLFSGTSLAGGAPEPPTPTAGFPGADFVCPDCHAPIRWDQDECPHCGAEFEPLKPRLRKGEAPKRDESPFYEAPPAERPLPKPPESIIDQPWRQIQPPEQSRFGFGSYGRVGIVTGTDFRGRRAFDVVDFRPRIEKGPYQELHFFYRDSVADLPVLVKTTLAADEALFHYNGRFDAHIALRELYAELNPAAWCAVWIGERMYRGDDIYIFDFWPLDDQNTLGGGAALKLGAHTLQVHAGFNRIEDDRVFYQFQEIEVPKPDSIETQKVVFLDRNRVTGSATYKIELPWQFKWKVHGELAYLPSGKRKEGNGTETRLPADRGWLAGTEIEKGFGASFARLFFRYADGLSAYDELSIPFGFDKHLEVTDSKRFIVGAGGAIDTRWFGMHWGGYWQRFEDSDGIDDRNDSDQYAVAVRPEVYLGDYPRVGFEFSWQGLQPKGVYSETGKKEFPQVTSLHFLLGLAAGRGPYARPVLYGFYGLHWLNEGARIEIGRREKDRPDAREDVIGLLAEWWF
jgi:maltoporin